MQQYEVKSMLAGRIIYKDMDESTQTLTLTVGNITGVAQVKFFGRRAYFYYFMLNEHDAITAWGNETRYGIQGQEVQLDEVSPAQATMRFKAAEYRYKMAEAEHPLYFMNMRTG